MIRRDRPTPRLGRESLLLVALVLTAWAAAANYGEYTTDGFALLLLAAVTACLAVRPDLPAVAAPRVWPAAVVLLAAGNIFLFIAHGIVSVPAWLLVLALSLAAAAAMTPRLRRVRALSLCVAAAAQVGLLALGWQWGHSEIDVFAALTSASGAILHGHNPYSSEFPLAAWTWPVMTGHVYAEIAHFQYGPMAAVLTLPGRLLGDVRVSHALATVGLVAAVWHGARRSTSGAARVGAPLAAAVMPFTVGMVTEAWVDVFMMAGFAGWWVLRKSHPRLAVVCLATCILVKPTVGIALLPPFVWLRSARRQALAAAAIALAVLIPLAIATGPAQLWHDVIGIQLSLPPRSDGLTVVGWMYAQFGVMFPTMIGTAVTAITAVFLLRRPPTGPADLLARAAALSIVAFMFAKWAFFNYYYISAVLLVLALGSSGEVFDPEDVALPLLSRLPRPRWALAQARSRLAVFRRVAPITESSRW